MNRDRSKIEMPTEAVGIRLALLDAFREREYRSSSRVGVPFLWREVGHGEASALRIDRDVGSARRACSGGRDRNEYDLSDFGRRFWLPRSDRVFR